MSRQILLLTFGLLALMGAPHRVAAQDAGHTHSHQRRPALGHFIELSERAQQQIRQVEASVRHLDTAAAASEAGFRPMFGWVPSMGVHWVSRERMGNGFDLANPDQLMFSPVDGTIRLVGVAYAFRGPPDAQMPAGFDGDFDRWHDHSRLALDGETLHMLHVWFVESPDGLFAGLNPWLPFFASGLTPPDVARMADPEADARIRALAAALATIAEPTLIERAVNRSAEPAVVRSIEARRDSIRGLVPQLDQADREGDRIAWDRLADEAAKHWYAIRDAWIDAIPFAADQERLASYVDAFMGSRGGHH